MNEFMGLIRGMYEAKQDGFLPGGCTPLLQTCFCVVPEFADVAVVALSL